MKLTSARVTGFRSFKDTGEVKFLPGVNLIVGQNNVGKTALLRALEPNLPDDRYRSPELWESFRLPEPEVQFTFEVTGEELQEAILRAGVAQFPIANSELSRKEEYVIDWLRQPKVELRMRRRPNDGSSLTAPYPSHGLHTPSISQSVDRFHALINVQNGRILVQPGNYSGGQDSIPQLMQQMWERNMFYFQAERMKIGQSTQQYVARLEPDAANLPAVLHTLNGHRPAVFQRLVAHLRQVFPTVGSLSIGPVEGQPQHVEVRVWPTEDQSHPDLSFPLARSGTGVSQVTALLAAIMTVDDAVIIIDEINSFLHPAAVKTLIRILVTEYGQHQYIISTHSPEVISFCNPSSIHLIKREGYVSTIEALDIAEVDKLQELSDHLGVSIADVFAASRLIWVEGPTEAICFPWLYQISSGVSMPPGTIVAPVANTGDFSVKKVRERKLVIDVYRKLSENAGRLVKSVIFSFDAEELTKDQRLRVTKESGGLMRFLPRRHLECYLINPAAIADFINLRDLNEESSLTADDVSGKIAELASSKYLSADWKGSIDDAIWQSTVDAANLIDSTIKELTDQRVTFNKKQEALELMQSIHRIDPAHLDELVAYVSGLLGKE